MTRDSLKNESNGSLIQPTKSNGFKNNGRFQKGLRGDRINVIKLIFIFAIKLLMPIY